MPRRVWHLPPDGFRELRRSCLLSRKACADLLGCSLSAVKAWDRGTHRVPWSAVKLLRLVRLGDLGTLRPEWRGWTLARAGLVSPEGIAYARGDLGWWSLTCRQAQAFRLSYDKDAQRRATGRSVAEPPSAPGRSAGSLGELPAPVTPRPDASLPAALAPASVPAGLVGDDAPAPPASAQREPPARGLSTFQQSCPADQQTVQRRGFAVLDHGPMMGPEWGHIGPTSETRSDVRDPQVEPSPARRSVRKCGQPRQRAGDQPERLPDPRHPQLGRLPKAGHAGRAAATAANGRGSAADSGQREGGPERSLSLRERAQVQTLPRPRVKAAGGGGRA